MTDRSVHIFKPSTVEHFKRRHDLLMKSLRSPESPFAIEAEYPLVLAETASQYSFCLGDGDELIAHANLFPRILVTTNNAQTFPVALIGNVATDSRRRGQGYMQQLIEKLENQAKDFGASALILWSDLYKFYQNLGFSSLGQEFRYFFASRDLAKKDELSEEFFPIEPGTLSEKELERLLAIRYPVPSTLKRATGEFRRLLEIPATLIFIGLEGGSIDSYFVIGKGCDMIGVVHEWGAPNPQKAVSALRFISDRLGYGEIVMLAPGNLVAEWQAVFAKAATKCEEHAMALGKVWSADAEQRQALTECFIWGLDSI